MRNNLALSQEEVAEGWALAYQSEARTPVLHVPFDEAAESELPMSSGGE